MKNRKSSLNSFQARPTLKHQLRSEEHGQWQNKDYAVRIGQNPKRSHGLQRPNLDWRFDCNRRLSVNSQGNYFNNLSAFGMEMRPLLWVQGMRETNNFPSLHLGNEICSKENRRSSTKGSVYSRSILTSTWKPPSKWQWDFFFVKAVLWNICTKLWNPN
jgi:hypothetical protein